MYPVLLHLGPFTISTLGFFIGLGLLSCAFVVWRLANVYDLDPEKTLDIIFLTFFAGAIGARAYYVFFHLSQINSPLKAILFNRYPGFSFWGGVLASFIMLYILSRRLKFDFWLVADLLAVGLFVGLSISGLGCFFSGCIYGLPSNTIFAVAQVGLVDKRFPIQILYSLLFFLSSIYLWRVCLRFHFKGKVASFSLLLLGAVTFILEFFRGDSKTFYLGLSLEHFFSLALFAGGVLSFYLLSKRSLSKDLKALISLITSPKKRKLLLFKLTKSWYNLKVNFKIYFSKLRKKISKTLNVKPNPTQF